MIFSVSTNSRLLLRSWVTSITPILPITLPCLGSNNYPYVMHFNCCLHTHALRYSTNIPSREEATISTHVMVISKGYKLRITYFLTFTLTRKQEKATSLEFEICFFPVSLYFLSWYFPHETRREKKKLCYSCFSAILHSLMKKTMHVYKLAHMLIHTFLTSVFQIAYLFVSACASIYVHSDYSLPVIFFFRKADKCKSEDSWRRRWK